MKRLRFATVVALFALSLSSLTQAATGPARARLDAFAQGLHAISGNFTQTLTTADGQPGQTSSGTLVLQAPRQFRWDTLTPYKQTIEHHRHCALRGVRRLLFSHISNLADGRCLPQSHGLTGTVRDQHKVPLGALAAPKGRVLSTTVARVVSGLRCDGSATRRAAGEAWRGGEQASPWHR